MKKRSCIIQTLLRNENRRYSMKKTLLLIILLFTAILVVATPKEVFASQAIEKSIKNYLGETNSSVTVRSAKTGKIIFEHNGSVPRQTASNLKLLTGAAALQELGEDYRFMTSLYYDGEIVDGVLNGNIYLKGSGDPTLQYKNLQTIAKQLAKKGVQTVNGQLYLDDTLFTDSSLPPGAVKSEQTYYYAARTSALHMSPNDDFDAGTVIVETTGTKSGQAPAVKVLPHISGQKVINKAKTGSKTLLSVRRQYNTNQIVISGTIAAGRTTKNWVTVQDPTIATGHAFLAALKSVGIQLHQATVAKKAVSEEAQNVYDHKSRTLAAMFPTFMKLSNNSMADTFMRTLAAKNQGFGSLNDGAKELKKSLAAIGIPIKQMTLVDGSGLSSKNRVQSNQISALLYEMQDEKTFKTFYESLPVGGQKDRLIGGTLKNRFTGIYKNRVIAKTGYIDNVYALSGFVKTKGGNTYIFSVLTEYRNSSAINGIDRVVKTIIDYH